MKKQNLLNFFNQEISKTPNVFYSSKSHSLYFNKKELIFSISSNATSIFLKVEENTGNNFFSESIVLTTEEALPLLKRMHFLYSENIKSNNYISSSIKLLTEEYYQKKVKDILDYLKKEELADLFKNHKKKNYDFAGFYVNVKLNNEENPCFFEKILDEKGSVCLFTSLIGVETRIKMKDNSFFNFSIYIPGWELNEYPILKEMLIDNVFRENKENEILEKIINTFPSGKLLLNELLKEDLKNNNVKAKKSKI